MKQAIRGEGIAFAALFSVHFFTLSLAGPSNYQIIAFKTVENNSKKIDKSSFLETP